MSIIMIIERLKTEDRKVFCKFLTSMPDDQMNDNDNDIDLFNIIMIIQ